MLEDRVFVEVRYRAETTVEIKVDDHVVRTERVGEGG
jgi:hypothetical protein